MATINQERFLLLLDLSFVKCCWHNLKETHYFLLLSTQGLMTSKGYSTSYANLKVAFKALSTAWKQSRWGSSVSNMVATAVTCVTRFIVHFDDCLHCAGSSFQPAAREVAWVFLPPDSLTWTFQKLVIYVTKKAVKHIIIKSTNCLNLESGW